MVVVDTVTNGIDLVAYFSKGNPGVDIALIDIGMPEMDGLTAVSEIKKICPNPPKMLVITGLRGHDFPTAAVSREADGFMTKFRSKEEILQAIRDVIGGKGFVYLPDPKDPTHPPEAPRPLPRIMPIERRVLCLLTKGMRTKDIADMLDIGIPHVDKIRRIVSHKLNADNPVMLGVIAQRYGLCNDIE